MAKLTEIEIEATKIIRATFSNDSWMVLVTDLDNNIYSVKFIGLADDSDDELLAKTHTELLDVDKYEAPVLPVSVERMDIYGLAPKTI